MYLSRLLSRIVSTFKVLCSATLAPSNLNQESIESYGQGSRHVTSQKVKFKHGYHVL